MLTQSCGWWEQPHHFESLNCRLGDFVTLLVGSASRKDLNDPQTAVWGIFVVCANARNTEKPKLAKASTQKPALLATTDKPTASPQRSHTNQTEDLLLYPVVPRFDVDESTTRPRVQ